MLEADITSLARAKWSIKLFYRPRHEGAWGGGEEPREGPALTSLAQGRPAGQDGFSHLLSTQKLEGAGWGEGAGDLSSPGLLFLLSTDHSWVSQMTD